MNTFCLSYLRTGCWVLGLSALLGCSDGAGTPRKSEVFPPAEALGDAAAGPTDNMGDEDAAIVLEDAGAVADDGGAADADAAETP